jgi:CRISPR type IV-associated protein Csf3
MFIPLQITAHLAFPLGVTDNFSPKIEGIIEYSVRESLGMLDPNPIRLEDIRPVELPLQKHSSGFYHCSSPHYLVERESQSRYRKRWDYQERCLDWGNKKAKFSGSDGHFKAYDLPLFLSHTSRIDWYVMGDANEILLALNRITHIGKKRSLGNGLVERWDIKQIADDWSLCGNKGQIMRPIPVNIYQDVFNKPLPSDLVMTAWRLPSWHIENQTLCVVPRGNVEQLIERPVLRKNAS